MKTAYRVFAYLTALSVAVQAALIAFGVFALEHTIDEGPVTDGDTTGLTWHHSFAYVVLLFSLALFAVSFAAKVEHGARWATLLSLIAVQFLLAYSADETSSGAMNDWPGARLPGRGNCHRIRPCGSTMSSRLFW